MTHATNDTPLKSGLVQPPEIRRGFWRDCRYALGLIGRYLRADPRIGGLLTIATFGTRVVISYFAVRFSLQLGVVIDAVTGHKAATLASTFAVLLAITLGLTATEVVSEGARRFLLIRWRTAFTTSFVERWMANDRYYQMRWDSEIDNPEQRVQEDIPTIQTSLLQFVSNIFEQVTVLTLSIGALIGFCAPLSLNAIGLPISIPYDLVTIALVMGPLWTLGAHYVGRAITRIEVIRQRIEADFRRGMGQTREFGEAIAFERGARREEKHSLFQYDTIRSNWMSLTYANLRLLGFNSLASFCPRLIPIALMAPRIMAGHATVGELTAAVAMFGSVLSAMTYFATSYADVATLRAGVARMRLFEADLDRRPESGIHFGTAENGVELEKIVLRLPDGNILLRADSINVRAGDRVLIRGRSGVGKSTMLRAVAGLWPLGEGTIRIPARERMLFLPQRSYMPDGALAGLLSYPNAPSTQHRAFYVKALKALSLDSYADRLDETAEWRHILSPGEQQRMAAARAVLSRPDFLFLDEATSALDVDLEAQLYAVLQEALPMAAIVSVAHRPTVSRFHTSAIEIIDGRAQCSIDPPNRSQTI